MQSKPSKTEVLNLENGTGVAHCLIQNQRKEIITLSWDEVNYQINPKRDKMESVISLISIITQYNMRYTLIMNNNNNKKKKHNFHIQ